MIELWTKQPNERARKRVTPAAVLSVGMHTVLLIAFWYALELPNPLAAFRSDGERREERLTYVGVRPPASSPARAAPSSRPAVPTPSAAQERVVPLPAPREIPTGIPTPARTPVNLGPTSGPAVGGQGPTKGVQPTYVDPRVWVAAPPLEPAPKTDEQRLDSAVAARIKAYNDSLLVNRHEPNKFERGDWTVERGGGKYGIDPQFIRLGKFSIPTALLSLLPINGGPGAASRELQQNPALALHRAEIPYQAQRAVTHEEFRRAVKQLRERKEREKREKEQTVAKKPIAPGP
ncbi:MAG: hypothetical protein ACREOG_14465 [Gemmatimonadaceae bacterium]